MILHNIRWLLLSHKTFFNIYSGVKWFIIISVLPACTYFPQTLHFTEIDLFYFGVKVQTFYLKPTLVHLENNSVQSHPLC